MDYTTELVTLSFMAQSHWRQHNDQQNSPRKPEVIKSETYQHYIPHDVYSETITLKPEGIKSETYQHYIPHDDYRPFDEYNGNVTVTNINKRELNENVNSNFSIMSLEIPDNLENSTVLIDKGDNSSLYKDLIHKTEILSANIKELTRHTTNLPTYNSGIIQEIDTKLTLLNNLNKTMIPIISDSSVNINASLPTSSSDYELDNQYDSYYDYYSGNFSCFSENVTCEHDYYRHTFGVGTILCLAYIVVFSLGLVGNCFVIAVVFRTPRMRTVTNYFIANLAFADVLVIAFCLPATLLSNIYNPWVLGWVMCKSVAYVQHVSVSASVNSLVAVSLDRFLAIWFPLKSQITKRRARAIIILIWIMAIVSAMPNVIYFEIVIYHNSDIELCMEEWPNKESEKLYFLISHLFLCYLLPLVLICICYVMIWIKVTTRSVPGETRDAAIMEMQQRSKIKVVKMLVVVVIIFMLSWLPLYVIFTRIKLGEHLGGTLNEFQQQLLGIVTPIAQWLGASNSCINPILYAFFNKKYRNGFIAIVKSRSCCATLRFDSYSQSTMRRSSYYPSYRSTIRPERGQCDGFASRKGGVYTVSNRENNSRFNNSRGHRVLNGLAPALSLADPFTQVDPLQPLSPITSIEIIEVMDQDLHEHRDRPNGKQDSIDS
ncbi:unnamed protein product, partial [Meganyctiphanes norvegica]